MEEPIYQLVERGFCPESLALRFNRDAGKSRFNVSFTNYALETVAWRAVVRKGKVFLRQYGSKERFTLFPCGEGDGVFYTWEPVGAWRIASKVKVFETGEITVGGYA